ncbi:MAG: hypothetical protein GXO49_02855, partial [Chlorobi bacterium]|nr:hypothetical protein [Chlorobiota bacterium]
LLKNFGTRQSKGFGNFFPVEKYDFLNTQSILPYYFDYDKEKLEYYNQYDKIKSYSLFQVINMFYNTLRSGINHRIYFKSFMWAYAKSKGEHWDKKTIKNRYLSTIQNQEIEKWKNKSKEFRNNPSNFPLGFNDKKNNNAERHLWRDLLGLSSFEKAQANDWKLKKEHIKEEINRFKSPLIFKPFQVGKNKYRVFFGVNPAIKEQFKKGSKKNSESEILGEEFNIKYRNNGGLKLKYLKTFDYDNFLKFAINTYNKQWVEKKFHNKNEFKIIDAIYSQLKTQLKNEK